MTAPFRIQKKTDDFLKARNIFIESFAYRRYRASMIICGIFVVAAFLFLSWMRPYRSWPLYGVVGSLTASVTWYFHSYRRFKEVLSSCMDSAKRIHEYSLAVPLYMGENNDYVFYSIECLPQTDEKLLTPNEFPKDTVISPDMIRWSATYKWAKRYSRSPRFRAVGKDTQKAFYTAINAILKEQIYLSNREFFEATLPFEGYKPDSFLYSSYDQ